MPSLTLAPAQGVVLDPNVPIPSVRRMRNLLLKNDFDRPAIAWGTADFSRLSAPHLDALQSIMSSILAGEVYGRDIYANLCTRVPYRDISDAYAAQILDESHHSRLLTRYLREEMRRPVERPILAARYSMKQLARLRDPLIATLTASLFVECTAAEMLAALVPRIEEPLLANILRTILRDEGRHSALGREASLFLLDTPRYKRGWHREKARLYRYFTEHFLYFLFRRYAKFAALLHVDTDGVCKRAIEKVHEVMP